LVIKNKQQGFSLVEVIVSLLLVSILLGVITSVVQNAAKANSKANLRAEASSLSFKKIQDYINLDFDSVPIGDKISAYETEDYSSEASAVFLKNPSAKMYVEPASQLGTPTTVSTTYTQAISADTSYISGAEIPSVGYNDATNDWSRVWHIRDNNYSNYTYSRWAPSPDNLASPSIDLGSAVSVDTIRLNWFFCGYGASNFRIEAKNSSPNSNSGWTTVTSGLSDNGIPCFFGNHPQDISVGGASYRYWRVFFVDSQNYYFAVLSELEAFSPGLPGDTVEQQGADATLNPGELYFSNSNLEMTEDGSRGHQSLGMIFNNVTADNSATINNAYLNFTAANSNSGPVTLLVKAPDVDNASPWSGLFAVDKAVDNDGSDGSVGTTASVTWTPNAWSNGESGPDTQVDVTAIIQELVNRAGWSTNNKLALTVQYVSGASKRVAVRLPAPQLVINWSESTTTTPGNYVDNNGDGDVDNPTLLKVTSVIEYDAFDSRQRVEYSTFIRKFGLGS